MIDDPEDAAWIAMLRLWVRLVAEGHISPEPHTLCTLEGERAWRQGYREAHAILQKIDRDLRETP